MYGRYLFLGLDDIRDENWIDVYTSRFVSSVLLHNMKPIWIPGRMIEEQKKISEECAFKLEQSLVDPVFRPGDKVSIIAGPFAGLKGTVKTKRIVEIELFRGKVDLSLPFHILERR